MKAPQANRRTLRSALVLGAWAALVALLPAPSASAAEITYTSLTGSWHDPVDNVSGSQPGDPVITNGAPTSIIRWGDDTPQSGYDFNAADPLPPPFELPGPLPCVRTPDSYSLTPFMCDASHQWTEETPPDIGR